MELEFGGGITPRYNQGLDSGPATATFLCRARSKTDSREQWGMTNLVFAGVSPSLSSLIRRTALGRRGQSSAEGACVRGGVPQSLVPWQPRATTVSVQYWRSCAKEFCSDPPGFSRHPAQPIELRNNVGSYLSHFVGNRSTYVNMRSIFFNVAIASISKDNVPSLVGSGDREGKM